MEQPTPLATRPTLFSTFTCRQTGTRVTGPTGAWPPRVRWTRDDNSISGYKTCDPDLNAFCTVFVCLCYCCFYNSINMMLFCHPIVSERCIMCGALFLQFPILNMGTGQTVIILQMAHGQQPANGMFVLINCLDFESSVNEKWQMVNIFFKYMIIDGINCNAILMGK